MLRKYRKPRMPRRDAQLDREIGARIREARVNKGIAQAALGRTLGRKSSGSMWKYEEGKAGLPPVALAKIAELLDVSLDWLINGNDRVGQDPVLSEADQEKLLRYHHATKEERAQWAEFLQVHTNNRIITGLVVGFLAGMRAKNATLEKAADAAITAAARDVGVDERQGRAAKPETLRAKTGRRKPQR